MGRTTFVLWRVGYLFPSLVVCAQLACIPRVAHSDDGAVTRQEIIQRHQEWRGRFVSIRVKWRSWHKQLFVQKHPEIRPEDLPGKIPYVQEEFAWVDWGAFRHDSTSFKDGLATFRDGMGTPGDRPWSVTSKYGQDPNLWDHLQFYRPDPARPLSSNITFKGIYGLWNGSGAWFSDVLAQSDVIEIGKNEDIDGHPCIVATVKEGGRVATYWLDPANSLLPRQYRIGGPGSAPDNSSLAHWYTWTVAEFQTHERGFVFPARGNLVGGAEQPPGFEWTIETVVLNESLPRSYFEAPKPHPRTRVTDYDRMKAYSLAPEPAAGSIAPANSSPDAAHSPVVAQAASFPWSWIALGAASLLAAGVILRWWRRLRHE